MKHRVVITGMGVVAANAHGLADYEDALRRGRSGIRMHPRLRELGFGCQVGGIPELSDETIARYFGSTELAAMNSNMLYGCIAGVDAWRDAGLTTPADGSNDVDWESGAVVGTGVGGVDTVGDFVVPLVNEGKVRRLGSTAVERTMASSVSAKLGGLLALGAQVTTNSSACTTGTEAVVDAYFAIREGRATRMLAGGSEGSSHYIWACFDAMRVLSRGFNDTPERASRPLSASAGGFVPSSGAGLLVLEALESATRRGARIYAEVLGGAVTCGGQRMGGSMTAPNPEGVVRCIRAALTAANIQPGDVDVINGHLTATMADVSEVRNWTRALERSPRDMPWLQSTKSLIGHGLGAAGGLECVASVLQLHGGFVHGSMNCDDVHPELEAYAERIPQTTRASSARVLAKASFGFGDVNGCVLVRRWDA